MIKVAICDDEKIFLDGYVKIINNIKEVYGYSIEIVKFNSGDELINSLIIDDVRFDIIFLDIIMGKINGIETAQKIRELDHIVEIIFLTSSKEYALESYEVKASNYIIKNSVSVEEKISDAIKYACSKVDDYILVTNKSSIEKVELRKIVYIESNKRKIIITTVKTKYEMYGKLDDLYEKINNKGFFKTHKSYIINRMFIKRIESKSIITSYGHILPISRSKVDEVKNYFFDYLENSN